LQHFRGGHVLDAEPFALGPRLLLERAVGRAKIPGGWLVGNGQTVLCFVPDPEHRWDGSSILDTNTAKDAKVGADVSR
jgi:hypothetical protein